MIPSHARRTAAAAFALAACSAHADTPLRFDITRFEIAGNTLLTPAQANAAVAPYAGTGRDFGDVQQALDALEAAYHTRGYGLVSVRLPEQELNRGVVRLNVVAARIGRVQVSGNQFASVANVRRSLPTLQEGVTPNLAAVSANLRMANENPARKITLKLQNAAADDVLDAQLVVADGKPWKAMLNLDNSGSDATGNTHAGVVLQHANLWGRDHVGSFQYTSTLEEPSKVSVYGLGYHIPLYTAGDSADLFASYSNIDSGAVAAGLLNLAVSGKGAVYGARYNHTLPRRGALDARLVYGVDVKAFKNSVLFGGQDFGNDITVRPVSLGWTGSRALADGDASVSLTLVRNIAGGSRGGAADFERNRAGAKASYAIVRFGAAVTRTLGDQWQARVLVNGQLTQDALVPGEQFGAGGASSVRGLDERAVVADSGVLINTELYSPNLCTVSARAQCRALAFIDAASATRNRSLPGEFEQTSVASVGLGLRAALGETASGQLDYGHVVQAGATTGARHKLHFRLAFAY